MEKILLNKYIDHTFLKQTTTITDVKKVCDEAIENKFAAVCVPPIYVEQAAQLLAESDVSVCTVIGFPMGYHSFDSKLAELDLAIEEGADELDVVMNIADLISGEFQLIQDEIKALAETCHENNCIIKVIIESGVLTDEQITKACEICAAVKVDFVKTSTGFAEKGATVEAVKLMRKILPPTIQIKASGGIKDFETAKLYIDAGATRIGTSNGVAILKGQKATENY